MEDGHNLLQIGDMTVLILFTLGSDSQSLRSMRKIYRTSKHASGRQTYVLLLQSIKRASIHNSQSTEAIRRKSLVPSPQF